MAGKKGTIPSHVKKKHFEHPGIDYPIISRLEEVEDPRHPSLFFKHSLTSILFMTLIGIMCGATDWPKVVIICEGLSPWLANYVDMSEGVPCERTFKNVINALKQNALEDVLQKTADLIREKKEQEVISFDGQTSRGTADRCQNLKGIHLINAWSSKNKICLGQLKVDEKTNEITAIPQLMEMLDLKGTIITTDALNTQKTTVDKAIEMGADYILPVKGNQPSLQEAVVGAFEVVEAERKIAKQHWEQAVAKARAHRDEKRLQDLNTSGISNCGASIWEDKIEKAHGRIESRTCMTIKADKLAMKEEWKQIKTLARIHRQRIIGNKMMEETAYYISSLESDTPELIGQAVREHWGVESLHWRLDVVFRQDQSRYRDRIGARNLAAMRKIVLNVISKETSLKGGIATKQCAAACNPVYRDKLIKNLF